MDILTIDPIRYISESSESVLFLASNAKAIGVSEEGQFVAKMRLPKAYRNEYLDKKLRKQRTRSETKILQKCNEITGLNTPKLLGCNLQSTVIFMEYISGQSLAEIIHAIGSSPSAQQSLCEMCRKAGAAIGSLHKSNIIHGDLTASNFLVQGPVADAAIYVIDFGLSFISHTDEDRAVDLYAFERCIKSIKASQSACMLESVYAGYASAIGNDDLYSCTMKKLGQVRLRGRKRSMVG